MIQGESMALETESLNNRLKRAENEYNEKLRQLINTNRAAAMQRRYWGLSASAVDPTGIGAEVREALERLYKLQEQSGLIRNPQVRHIDIRHP